MPIHSFKKYLNSYHYMSHSCYLRQVYICLYHQFGSGWLSLFQVYSCLQVQPGSIPTAAGLIYIVNERRYGNNTLCPIGWSVALAAGFDTVHPHWMALSFHRPTVKKIGPGQGGSYVWDYVLDPFVIGWPSLWMAKIRPLLRIIFDKWFPLLIDRRGVSRQSG